MSAYITRYCPTHGEWDMDTDLADECPQCFPEGVLAEVDRLRAALANQSASHGDRAVWAEYERTLPSRLRDIVTVYDTRMPAIDATTLLHAAALIERFLRATRA